MRWCNVSKSWARARCELFFLHYFKEFFFPSCEKGKQKKIFNLSYFFFTLFFLVWRNCILIQHEPKFSFFSSFVRLFTQFFNKLFFLFLKCFHFVTMSFRSNLFESTLTEYFYKSFDILRKFTFYFFKKFVSTVFKNKLLWNFGKSSFSKILDVL